MRTKNQNKPIIINQVHVRSADRTNKDIASWRNAISAAESVQYPNRTRLYDLYEDIILDGHLSGVIAKKAFAVINREVYFEKDGKRLQEMDPLICSLEFRQVVKTIIDTLLWGISALEFVPGDRFSFNEIPRKHIKPDLGIIAYEQSGNDGISYRTRDNVWVMGQPHDLGLLLKCAPYCLYKRGGIGDWAQFIELFGQPVRVMRYNSYDEQTKAELQRIIDQAGSALSIMIPQEAEFEIKDGKQANSDGGLQASFIKAMNEEISVTVLGNTETTNSSRSAGYAQSRIHQEQQFEITKADIAYTAAMLNTPEFMNILRSYGYPVDGGRFVFSKDKDVEYLHKRIEIDRQIAEIIPVSEDYWRDTYGITEKA